MASSPSEPAELVRRLVSRRRVPGAAVGIVTRDGVETWTAGVRRRGRSDPIDEADQWHIGSCGKAITAALYGRLVELGAARWGAPISEVFEDCAGRIRPEWAHRTLDEMFHCRAGIAANPSWRQLKRARVDDRPLTEQRTDTVISALACPPAAPGRFVYSNLGYIVLGAAIDRLAGSPFEDALAHHLLAPLGITSLGFGPPPDIWGHRTRVQVGGLCVFRGPPVDPTDSGSDNPPLLSSAGTMHLTVQDWARFHRLFLLPPGDRALLTPTTVDHLLEVPDGRGSPMAMGWARADKLEGVSFGMQGSNTFWAATALIDDRRQRVAFAVANDGRTRTLTETALLAASLLALPS